MTTPADDTPDPPDDDENTDDVDTCESVTAPREPLLVVIAGAGTGISARIGDAPLVIGRDLGCGLALEGSGISRHHASVKRLPDGDIVREDQGSTNGTFVDGKRIAQQSLVGGEYIQLGPDTVLKFEYDADPEAKLREEELEQSILDQSTRLHNRRHFLSLLRRDFVQVLRERRSVSMIKLCIDGYSDIINEHGYDGSERVLRRIALLVRANLHEEDPVARWGEKKVAILLNNTSAKAAARIAEQLVVSIRSSPIQWEHKHIQFTISAGVATVTGEDVCEPADLLGEADDNLTKAREAGGDGYVAGVA